jgi:hypothetical protein
MDYFAKFLAIQAQPKPVQDPLSEFHKSWNIIKVSILDASCISYLYPTYTLQTTLEHPDERQLNRGIAATDVPFRLRSLGDALVHESSLYEYSGYVGMNVRYYSLHHIIQRYWTMHGILVEERWAPNIIAISQLVTKISCHRCAWDPSALERARSPSRNSG